MKKIPAHLDKLPAYTGLENVYQTGLAVEQCATYIARIAAVKKQGVQIAATRMTGTPEWELKASLGRWLWEDATHYRDLEKRLTELRSNKTAIDKVLAYPLGDLLMEILQSPGSLELCVGLFDVLSPAFCEALKYYISRTNALVDQPSVRILNGMLQEEEERLEVGREFVKALASVEKGKETREDWKQHFTAFLAAAGGILGEQPVPNPSHRPKPRAQEEYRLSREFKRDERFKTVVPKTPPKQFEGDDLRMMMWVRSQEMTAAEMMASVIAEWEDLPIDALVDLARHCWDEVRHSLFGCAALEANKTPPSTLSSWIGYAHHTLNVSPQKRYSHLAIATEAGSMAYPGGKRGEWEFCRDQAKHPLMSTFQDFDWADEVTHVNFGRRWLIDYYFKGDREAARKMADETSKERKDYYAKVGATGTTDGY
jgi:hypothetical protein